MKHSGDQCPYSGANQEDQKVDFPIVVHQSGSVANSKHTSSEESPHKQSRNIYAEFEKILC